MDRIFILQYRSGLDTRNPSAPCHTRFPRHAGHGFRPGHHHPGPRRLRHRLHRIPDRRPDPGAGARFRRVGPAGRATGRAVRLHGHAGRPAAHGRAGARGTQAPVRRHPAGLAGANALAALPNLVLALARFIPALALPVFWGTASEAAARMAAARARPCRASTWHLRRPAVRHPDRHAGGGHRLARQLLGLAALSLLLAALMARHMPALSQSARTPLRDQARILKDPLLLAHIGLSVAVFTAMFTATPTWPTSWSGWPAWRQRRSAGG